MNMKKKCENYVYDLFPPPLPPPPAPPQKTVKRDHSDPISVVECHG